MKMKRLIRKKDRIGVSLESMLITIMDHDTNQYIHPEIVNQLISEVLDIAEAVGAESCKKRILEDYLSR